MLILFSDDKPWAVVSDTEIVFFLRLYLLPILNSSSILASRLGSTSNLGIFFVLATSCIEIPISSKTSWIILVKLFTKLSGLTSGISIGVDGTIWATISSKDTSV